MWAAVGKNPNLSQYKKGDRACKRRTGHEADLGLGSRDPLGVSQMRDGDGEQRDQPQVLKMRTQGGIVTYSGIDARGTVG